MSEINPAWLAIGLAVLNIAFMAGVTWGTLPQIRRQSESNAKEIDSLRVEMGKLSALPQTIGRLAESIETAARGREEQVKTLTEIKVRTETMQAEVQRLRDERAHHTKEE